MVSLTSAIPVSQGFGWRQGICFLGGVLEGVDIGAKEHIYHLMVELASQGKSIMMISSDMPELISLSEPTPFSPPSGPAQRLLHGPPVRSKFLAALQARDWSSRTPA